MAGTSSAPEVERGSVERSGRVTPRFELALNASEQFLELVPLERLGDEAVHSRVEALIPFRAQNAGRHGHDRRMAPGLGFRESDAARHFESVETRHLNVHQDRIETPVPPTLQGLCTVACELVGVPHPIEKGAGHALVDGVVLGQQKMQRARRGLVDRSVGGDLALVTGEEPDQIRGEERFGQDVGPALEPGRRLFLLPGGERPRHEDPGDGLDARSRVCSKRRPRGLQA